LIALSRKDFYFFVFKIFSQRCYRLTGESHFRLERTPGSGSEISRNCIVNTCTVVSKKSAEDLDSNTDFKNYLPKYHIKNLSRSLKTQNQ
jgi:hypothetical protein